MFAQKQEAKFEEPKKLLPWEKPKPQQEKQKPAPPAAKKEPEPLPMAQQSKWSTPSLIPAS